MAIYLIRHGDKELGTWLKPGLPSNDQPLSGKGRADSLRLPAYFQGLDIQRILASRYRRTEETIRPLAETRGLPVEIDGRLDEIDVGLLDRLPDAEIQARYPDFWRAYKERKSDFRFPGGESGEEATLRIRGLFDSLDRSANQVLATHDGLIRLLLCSLLGLPPYRRNLFKIDTCSVTELAWDEEFGLWKLVRVNQRPTVSPEGGA